MESNKQHLAFCTSFLSLYTFSRLIHVAAFILFKKVFYIFIAARGLSLVATSGGYPAVAVHGLLIVVAPLAAERGLQACWLC